MGSHDVAGEPGRYFVGIGVGVYDDASLNLGKAESDVADIASWFTSGSGIAHAHVLPALGRSPRSEEILTALREFLLGLESRDVVVIYIACHGELEGARAHLFGRNTPRRGLAGRSIDASTLGAVLGQSKPHNVLLIIDACVAGRLGSAVQRAAEDASDHEGTRDPHLAHAQVVVASAYGRDPALDGRFASAFLRVVSDERWTGTGNRWISLEQLLNGLNEELRDLGVPQVVEGRFSGTGAIELIPNPNMAARKLGQLIAHAEYASHFDPSARGVGRGEQGSFFTGREQELRRIVRWLDAPGATAAGDLRDAGSPPSLLAITGGPGAGKSALLSRIAVLADPTHRPDDMARAALAQGTVPREGALDAVIWCHNKTERQVIEELGRALGGSATTPETLRLLASRRKATIAIDALDEIQGGQARQVASRVLKPLAAVRGIRLLVATRRRPVRDGAGGQADLLDHLGVQQAAVIDLDAARDTFSDMQTYVESRIRALAASSASDAASAPARAPAVSALAARIATAAGKSFLVAAIAARSAAFGQLRGGDGEFVLPTEVGAALAGYIESLADPVLARRVLRPLAWSQGAGLPWGALWAPLARALAVVAGESDPSCGDDDIRVLLDTAGDLVVESIEAGQPVYRLFHEALAEHLRADTDEVSSHDAIASTMLHHIGARTWPQVMRYVTTNLPMHLLRAARTEELIGVLVDPVWDRCVRAQSADSLAAIGIADATIERLLAASATDLRVVPICLVHSRAVTLASPLLLDVLARSGQMARAEMLANNLEYAPDRMHAYRHLCAAHARVRDAAGAMRCLGEVRRTLPAMPRVHQPMAWCWVAECAHDAGVPAVTTEAAAAAVAAALALEGDDWDLPNACFWAARACALADLGADMARLREALDAWPGSLWRNQALQAASMAGHVPMLLQRLADYLAGARHPSGGMRDGNLALALAAAGMMEEVNRVFAHVGSSAPSGEQDSLKRWAWALALDGQMARALDALKLFHEPVEKCKAIARIADVAFERADATTLDALAALVAPLLPLLHEARARARLIRVLWLAGEQADALRLVEEEIARSHVAAPVADPRDGIGPDAPASAAQALDADRRKTKRREMVSTVVLVDDAMAANEAASAARSSRLEEAKGLLGKIRLPRYRARVLAAIAVAEPQPDAALSAWLRAMSSARHAGRGAVEDIRDIGRALLVRAAGEDRARELDAEISAIDARWELEAFSEQYEALRRTRAAGVDRTRRMTALLHVPRRLALSLAWKQADVEAGWASGEDGKRLFMLGLMQAAPQLAVTHVLEDAIRGSRSAFEQYHALLAAVNAQLRGEQWQAVRAAAEAELRGDARADGVEAGLGQDSERRGLAQRLLLRQVEP